MESYKIAAITPDSAGFLNLWTADGRVVPVRIPISYRHLIARGMRLHIYRNRADQVVAYSFGDSIILPDFPRDYNSAKKFLNGFKDAYHLSLDSIMFKYRVSKLLRKIGMTPTRDSRVNLMMYKYCNDWHTKR